MTTVGEMKEAMRERVRAAAETVGIEVNSITMRSICAMDPFIEACKRLERAERLLADAKRMAEFGDINADMDDDGIGWKQWYLDVSAVLPSADTAGDAN